MSRIVRYGIFALLAMVVLGLFVLFAYRTLYSATITLVVAPFDAQIYLDGAPIKNRGVKRVRPGDYEISVSREGFGDEKQQVTIRRNDAARILMALLPLDGNYQWYIDHPDDSLILDSVMSERATEREQAVGEQFPVLAKLPHQTNFYELTLFALPTEANPKLTFRLTIFEIPRDGILATPEKFAAYSAEVRDWLAGQGLDEDEYEIVSGN